MVHSSPYARVPGTRERKISDMVPKSPILERERERRNKDPIGNTDHPTIQIIAISNLDSITSINERRSKH